MLYCDGISAFNIYEIILHFVMVKQLLRSGSLSHEDCFVRGPPTIQPELSQCDFGFLTRLSCQQYIINPFIFQQSNIFRSVFLVCVFNKVTYQSFVPWLECTWIKKTFKHGQVKLVTKTSWDKCLQTLVNLLPSLQTIKHNYKSDLKDNRI